MAREQQQRSPRGRRHTFSGAADADHFEHEVLEISRVVRVVKGGRRFRFRASVIVGDRAGTVGFGVSKSRDIQEAIQKAQDQASKHTVTVNLQGGTIPQPVTAKYKGAKVMLRPARPGTGVIAGSSVRVVADMAGIQDLTAKRLGSSNRISTARATLAALQSIAKNQALREALPSQPTGKEE